MRNKGFVKRARIKYKKIRSKYLKSWKYLYEDIYLKFFKKRKALVVKNKI